MATFDLTTPKTVTITNVIDVNDSELVLKDCATGKRQVMKLADAKAKGFTDFEYMLDKDGNFITDPVSGATATPASNIVADNVLVIVRQSVKNTDRYIQFFATQQKILLAAGESVSFTVQHSAALAHFESLAVDGEISVEVTEAADDSKKK